MATISFFRKPGCINNGRQKELLEAAGHTLIVNDITACSFTRETLRQFFGTLPVVEWFNYTAPAIKNGLIDPSRLTDEQAIDAMLADRLLIRRPLLQIGTERFCGFDLETLRRYIPLEAQPGKEEVFFRHVNDDIVTCPNGATTSTCTPIGGNHE